MVSNSYGSAIDRFRCPAPVESGRRCGDADLDYRVVRSHIRCPGNLSWLSLAQLTDIACTLISRTFRFRSTARAYPVRRLSLSFSEFLRAERFFARPTAVAAVLLKKMQPGAIDLAISLRRWHMDHLMFRVEFATAKKGHLFQYPTL